MIPLSPSQVIESLEWRYATKQFDASKKIDPATWSAIEDSLVLTPSSFGMQPWKFFVITDDTIRQQLLEHSWKQAQVVDASHVVVLAIKKQVDAAEVDRYMASTAAAREIPVESLEGFSKVIKGFLANPNLDKQEWAAKQVYIALGQLMATAALLGVDACPMEGFVPAKYDEVLGLDKLGYASVLVCPLGYRHSDDKYATQAKVRYPKAEVVQHLP
ncbi:MAG: NAD(P)H-dependent oxidoreductase [Synechococcales cyanobacterium RM1_1_8]|nr:NAD(P)H-dependent oxidoreductase [Synechococcales cyanobacterium RM1_1_8]